MNNNLFVDYTFTLIISSCGSLVLTPSTHLDVLYLIISPTAVPVTVSLAPFTSNKPVSQCGALAYSLLIKSSTISTATNTALTSPPFTHIAGTLNFVIAINDAATYDLQEYELEL